MLDTAITLAFADGDYCFDLKLPQIIELQDRCGKGILEIYSNVMAGRGEIHGEKVGLAHQAEAGIREIYETIRLGLIGGNNGIVDGEEIEVGPNAARELVKNYAHSRPIEESWALASAILIARVKGYEKAERKKKGGTAAKAKSKSEK